MQLYIMEKKEISFGRGTLVLLLRWIFSAILVVTLLSFLLPIFCKQSGVIYIRVFLKLGVEMSFLQAVFLPLVVTLFTFFAPTPGATGVYEGGFAILFSSFVVKHLLGMFTILWRFFTYYLAAKLGGLVTLKVLKLGEKRT